MAGGVVDTLMVELDGRTAKLQSALADAEMRLKKFQASTTAVSEAGEGMGMRYGRAAERIAGASAQMAAMGDISVSSGKQVLKSASEIAFAFGPTGYIVGAVGLSIVAMVALFNRAAEEAKKAREKIEAEFATLQKNVRAMIAAGDVAGLGKLVTQNVVGDVTDPGLKMLAQQLATLKRQQQAFALLIAQHKADLAAGKADDFTFGATKAQAADVDRQIEAMEKRVNDAQRRVNMLRASVGGAITTADRKREIGKEEGERDWRIADRAAALAIVLEAQKKLDEMLKQDREKAAADLLTFQGQYALALVRSTATLTDDISREFDALIKKATDLGQTTAAIQLTALRDSAVETQRFLEGVASDLAAIENAGKDNADTFNALQGLIDRIQGELTDTTLADADRARLNAELAELYKKQGVAAKDIAKATGTIVEKTTEALDKARAHAYAIQQAVDGALQLAEAFGLVDQKTGNILRSISQIAAGIGPLSEAIKLGAGGQIATSALPVVGAIATFVTSMVESGRAEREAQLAAIRALQSLTAELTESRKEAAANPFERELLQAQADQAKQFQQIVDDLKASGLTLTPNALAMSPRALAAALGAPTRFGWSGADEPRIAAAIAALNALADAAAETAKRLKESAAAAGHTLDEDMGVRRLRLAGENDAADVMALRNRLEAEYNEKKATGLYTETQLIELQQLEADELAKFIQDQADAHAKELANAEGDAQTRIDIANAANDREAADIRRKTQQAQELANVTDPALRALIELAQAAENAATAADQLAAAHRGLEDLDVRDLRARGETDAADRQAFDNAQRREAEDARKRGETQEYLDKLAKTQADELTKYIADHTTGAVAPSDGGGGGGGSAGASTAQSVLARGTLQQFDTMIALTRTEVSLQREIRDAIRAQQGLGVLQAPGLPSSVTFGTVGAFTFNGGPITIHTTDLGSNPGAVAAELGDLLYRDFSRRIARELQRQQRATGTDGARS